MTSVAPASPCLVLQARFQVLPGAQSLHPTQVPRAAFPGSEAVQRAERGSRRRLPSVIGLVPRAALGGPRAPQGPGAGRGRDDPPRTLSPRGSVSTREGRPQAGADERAGLRLQVPPQAAATRPRHPGDRTGRPRLPPYRAGRPPPAAPGPCRGAGTGRSGSGHGARAGTGRRQLRARGALETAPAGHVTADVTEAGRPSREPGTAAAVRGGRISRERGRSEGRGFGLWCRRCRRALCCTRMGFWH